MSEEVKVAEVKVPEVKPVEVKPAEVKVEVKPKIEPPSKMNFGEYKLSVPAKWLDAFKCYAEVKSNLDEKTKEEWDKLFYEVQNRRIG